VGKKLIKNIVIINIYIFIMIIKKANFLNINNILYYQINITGNYEIIEELNFEKDYYIDINTDNVSIDGCGNNIIIPSNYNGLINNINLSNNGNGFNNIIIKNIKIVCDNYINNGAFIREKSNNCTLENCCFEGYLNGGAAFCSLNTYNINIINCYIENNGNGLSKITMNNNLDNLNIDKIYIFGGEKILDEELFKNTMDMNIWEICNNKIYYKFLNKCNNIIQEIKDNKVKEEINYDYIFWIIIIFVIIIIIVNIIFTYS
jgi:hypothetical protein